MFLFISFAFFLFFWVFFPKFHYDLLINLDCYNSKLIIIRINVLIFICKFKKKVFLAILGLRYNVQASLVATSGGYSLVEMLGLLTVGASFVVEHGL